MDTTINDLEKLNVTLSGQAVKDGEIDINNYIEYLSGIAELCKTVNCYVNPGTVLDVKVHYLIEKGSIVNLLHFCVNSIGLFTGVVPEYSVEDLLAIIGFIDDHTGLLQLLKFQKQQKLKGKLELSNGNVQFEFEGENANDAIVEVSKIVADIYQNPEIRKKVDDGTKILKKDGFEKLGFRQSKDKEYNYIDKRDVPYFEYKQNVKDTQFSVYEANVDIVIVPTKNFDNKWKFQENNEEPYWASVKDDNFKNIVRQEGFKPPFSLRARIQKEQKTDENYAVIEVEKEILEVLEIITLPEQEKFV